MKATVGIALMVTALAATAQTRPESGPETRGGIEALKPLMAAARARGADVASVATIAEGLLATEWAIAAPWWLDLIPPDTKMLPAEKEAMTKLRRACEKPEAFAEERKIILRLIRQAESLIADKNWEEARQAAGAASGILGLVPDPAMARLLDALEKRIPPRKPDELPSSRWTKPAWAPGLEVEAGAVSRKLIERAVAAYGEAGCRPGRYALARCIRRVAIVLNPLELGIWLDKMRELTPQVEPRSVLVLFVRSVGTARLFLDGSARPPAPGQPLIDAEKQDAITIPVLPGDEVVIALDEAYSTDDVEGKSFVMALNARFEARDLGLPHLFADLGPDPGAGTLIPPPIAKKKPNPPKSLFGRNPAQDEELRLFNSYFELPKTTRRSVDVPCLGDMVGFEKEFDARKLGIVWLGTEADRFAIVIKVPDS